MKTSYVLYNPFAKNNQGEARKDILTVLFPEKKFIFLDIVHIKFEHFFEKLPTEDEVIICGGDGTLNKFVNSIDKIEIKNDIFYYPCGTGNDFARDICDKLDLNRLYSINEYLYNLPVVTINGKSKKFLNGIGYGIDGYVCAEADNIAQRTKKAVNYTKIATKGLIYDFKPRNATVTIDGKTFEFKKTWLAPTMNGKFFGGGMMIAPNQDRKSGKVTIEVIHDMSRLSVLTSFPKIFKGTHTKLKQVDIFEADYVKVEFDKPCALQIDGELVPVCSGYSVKSADAVKNQGNHKILLGV